MAPTNGESLGFDPQASRRRRKLLLGIGAVVAVSALIVLAVLGSKGILSDHPKGKTSDAEATAPSASLSVQSLGAVENSELPTSHTTVHVVSTQAASPSIAPSTKPSTAVVVSKDATTKDAENDDEEPKHALVQGNVCFAADPEELYDAIEVQTCDTVVLTGTEDYDMEDEAVVTRRVTVQGSPTTMPLLSAEEGTRSFRVKAGGHLTLKYVRMIPSEGNKDPEYNWTRDRHTKKRRRSQEEEVEENWDYRDIRGGTVLFENGAIGGLFVGVIFLEEETLESQIRMTLEQTTVRIYGEFVLMFGGTVNFVGCIFWEVTALIPITDRLYFGGWVLVLGGTATFTACSFFEINGFGVEMGVGLNVAVLGGNLIVQYSQFFESNLGAAFLAVGEAFLVGGGVAVYTGMSFTEWSALLNMMGTGVFTVLGGTQISTGVFNGEAIGVGSIFGAGMEWCVGAGVSINVGVYMLEIYNIFMMGTAGEVTFLGEGTYVAIGSPFWEWSNVITESGAGGFGFFGDGLAIFYACPVYESGAALAVYGIGEFFALGGGLMIWLDSPFMEFIGMEYMALLGSALAVGTGALWIENSSILEYVIPDLFYAPIYIDFWVNGACEAAEEEAGGGVGGLELFPPLFITYWTGCDKYGNPPYIAPVTDSPDDWFAGNTISDYGWVKNLHPNDCQRNLEGKEAAPGAASAPEATTTATLRAEAETADNHRRQQAMATAPATPTVHVVKEQAMAAAAAPSAPSAPAAAAKVPAAESSKMQQQDPERNARLIRRRMTGLDSFVDPQKLSPTNVQLYMKNIERTTATPKDIMELNAPEQMKEALMNAYNIVSEMRGKNGSSTPSSFDNYTMLHVNSHLHGLCYLCDVDGNATGAGGKYCVHQDECSADFVNPVGGLIPRSTSKESQNDTINYTPYLITIASMTPTLREGVKVSLDALQQSCIEAISTLNGDKTVVVQASPWMPSLPPAMMAALKMTPLDPSTFQTADFSTTDHFKVTFTAPDKESGDRIRALIRAEADGDEPAGGLSDLIKQHLLHDHNIEVGHLGVQQAWAFDIPAYTAHSMAHENGITDLGSHTVMLIDPEQPAIPVENIHYNRRYKLHLENFAANTRVSIQLLKHTAFGDLPASISVVSATTDANGQADIDYTFKSLLTPPGEYLFKGTSTDESYGESSMYTVTSRRYQRKMYGASVWI